MIPSLRTLGGYVWKFPNHITRCQRANLRKRSLQVDENIEQIYQGLYQQQKLQQEQIEAGVVINTGPKVKIFNQDQGRTGEKRVDFHKFEYPKFLSLSQRDKYFTFNRNAKNYRKPIHRVPKWTKTSFRENPKYF
ncbi:mitochondrial 54S ribosomal mL60 domain-containing protein [Lodderomyces beijingensis]|uniref:54S ribosomal protein L31, mitochondrial n=1 Tax=Lodderomyces beijingensis TaxID=1775926 RepID=A0ABP0ZFK3_9ASCO